MHALPSLVRALQKKQQQELEVTMFYPTVIFLVTFSAMVSASHFRGGIFMVRPLVGGESASDVSLTYSVVIVVADDDILETLLGANCISNKIDSLNMYLKKNYQTTPVNRQ